MSDDRRSEIVAGLRAVADFFETHLDSPLPYSSFPIDIGCDGDEDKAAAEARSLGECEKQESGDSLLVLAKKFGPVRLRVVYDKGAMASCRRVQVGTRKVSREVVVKTEAVEVEEPVYEWRCGSVLKGGEEEIPAARRVLLEEQPL